MFDRPAIKSEAKLRMREHKPSVYIVTLVFLVITTLLSIIDAKLSGAESLTVRLNDLLNAGVTIDMDTINDLTAEILSHVTPFATILTIIIALVTAVIEVGYTRFSLNVWKREPATTGTLFDEFGHFFKVIWLDILMGIFVLLWSLLLIIPGIIAAYRYSFAHHILIENPEMKAIDCIRESKRLTRGYKWDLFVLDLSFIGWLLVGAVIAELFGIVTGYSIDLFSIWLMPYMAITKSGVYRMRMEKELYVPQPPQDVWEA